MGIALCLIISIFSYTKIFLILRYQQNHVQDLVQQQNQTSQLNIARYKKAVSTAIWLQLTCSDGFGNCWKTIFTSLSWLDLLIHFSFLKLFIKPDSLLLEDR